MVQQQELVLSSWDLTPDSKETSTSLSLRSPVADANWSFTFETIRSNLFRTTFSSESHPLTPFGNARVPKIALDGLHPIVQGGTRSRNIQLNDIEVQVAWGHTPHVSIKWAASPDYLHQDLEHRSYVADGPGAAHYSVYKKRTLHVGLGEKAAPMDLSGRSFVMSATDCFGYDVYRTDPMYKHIPLLINATPQGCVAIFSTSHARGLWSVGTEMDGLWGPFKTYRQAYGGLEEYLIVGKNLQEIVRTYADVVGYPKLVPRWGFGYLAGGMKYSMLDEPRAADALMEFADQLKHHDIPCSGLQMSSGYTVAETEPKTRNVFTWNKYRFPDPEQFIKDYHARGIRLLFNVKPYVLANHPEYPKLVTSAALFTDPKARKSAIARLWSAGGGQSGTGGHLDFTSTSGFQWWYNGVQSLRKIGVDGIWNDNNEFTVPNDDWECALTYNSNNFSPSQKSSNNTIGWWGRALHTELMAQSSHAAVSDLYPDLRPFILTRSATPGTMRFANTTWSGDNVTSWAGMKGSVSLSLNSGYSLLHNSGHDIGGFEGPQPTPELLVRWVQLGIYSPKFAINCYKTSPEDNIVGDVIEPWMHPEVTHLIRAAIKRRYEIMPYVYSLSLESHLYATPPMRWVGWGYESDPEVWKHPLKDGETQFWFGDSMLIAGVFEEGSETARVYLPKSDDKTNNEDQYILLSSSTDVTTYHQAGKWHTLPSPYKSSIPVLAKVGSAIPIGRPHATRADAETEAEWPGLPADDWRGVEIFPPPCQDTNSGSAIAIATSTPAPSPRSKVFTSTWYEDDGTSRFPSILAFDLTYYISTIPTSSPPTQRTSSRPSSASSSDSGIVADISSSSTTAAPADEEVIIVSLNIRPVTRRKDPSDDPAEIVEEKWRPKDNNSSSAVTDYRPLWYTKTRKLDIVLPKGEKRRVVTMSSPVPSIDEGAGDGKGAEKMRFKVGFDALDDLGSDDSGRKVFALAV